MTNAGCAAPAAADALSGVLAAAAEIAVRKADAGHRPAELTELVRLTLKHGSTSMPGTDAQYWVARPRPWARTSRSDTLSASRSFNLLNLQTFIVGVRSCPSGCPSRFACDLFFIWAMP